jgi:hypothetical protein
MPEDWYKDGLATPDHYALVRSRLPRPVGAQGDVVALQPHGQNVILGTAETT